MVRCGGCSKRLAPTEAATCDKCRSGYHRPCVGLPTAGAIPNPWHCPECNKHVMRDNKADTPVRGRTAAALEPDYGNMTQTTQTGNNTAQELSLDVLRAELKSFQNEFLLSVRNEFQHLRDDLSELRSSIKATNDRLSNLEERVVLMENAQPKASSEADALIKQLRQDINDRNQELLANDIQISNIPEINGENSVHTALLIASTIGVKIEPRDIVCAERVGGRRINATQASAPVQTRPRFLVVRLARRDLRDEVLEAARVRRGITTADLNIPGPATRFYVNERLTKYNRELFRSARDAGIRHGWQFVWCKRGRILARHKPGDPAFQIRCEVDIQRAFGASLDSLGSGGGGSKSTV